MTEVDGRSVREGGEGGGCRSVGQGGLDGRSVTEGRGGGGWMVGRSGRGVRGEWGRCSHVTGTFNINIYYRYNEQILTGI
jgi:hypothetical protein